MPIRKESHSPRTDPGLPWLPTKGIVLLHTASLAINGFYLRKTAPKNPKQSTVNK
jgi:hypothetical protein